MFDEAFDECVHALETVNSETELRAFISVLLARYGLKHAVYHAVSVPGVEERNIPLVLTYPEDWVHRYLDQDYFTIDPVISKAAISLLPLDWSTLDIRNGEAKRFFGEAGEFGIGLNGLTFPIRGPSGDFALFSITSDLPRPEWLRVKGRLIRDLQVLAHYVHGKVMQFAIGPSYAMASLSPRERQCLRLGATGLTNKQIAWEIKISERVVRAYFESARHKLHCLNRSHVVARAVDLKIISSKV